MQVKKVVEREDGAVIFQAVLEGPELAFVIECGIEAIMQNRVGTFASTLSHAAHDFHETPEDIQ